MQEMQRKESQSLTGTPNLFVYGNDVDSVDIAVRVAMVSIHITMYFKIRFLKKQLQDNFNFHTF